MKAQQLKYTVCTVEAIGGVWYLRRRLATFSSLADAEDYANRKRGGDIAVVESSRILWDQDKRIRQ